MAACAPTKKRLPHPNALVYSLCNYDPGQRTFLPRAILSEHGEVLDNLDTVAVFMAQASARPGYRPLVLGHADPSGASAKNREISKARAESVWAFLVGDADLWLRSLKDDDEQAAMRVLLDWVSERFSWDVHTGHQDGWDQRCDVALATYRKRASVHLETELRESDTITLDDWHAAFALMEGALCASLLDAPESLRTLRDRLAASEVRRIACGDALSEQGPLEERNPSHDRRVELVLLEDESFVLSDDALAERVYGQRIQRVRMPVATRTALHLDYLGPTDSDTSPRGGEILGSQDVHATTVWALDLAYRIRAAIEAHTPEALPFPLTLSSRDATSIAKTYAQRFGSSVVKDVVAAASGSPLEPLVRGLLARTGLEDSDVALHRWTIEPSPRSSRPANATIAPTADLRSFAERVQTRSTSGCRRG